MPLFARDAEIRDRFLEELAETLDIEKTITKLNITGKDARAILKSLISRKRTAAGAVRGGGAYGIYVDGASRGNPGEAGAGAVIISPEGVVLKRLKKYLGTTTNNMAEYHALLIGLEAARALGAGSVTVFADSELMVKQINGLYRVRSEDLRPLFEKATEILAQFRDFKVKHVYREKNSIADSLANEAIDTHGK